MEIDPRFIQEAGAEIFTGNELLVKGALETEGGVHLLTGYPGSPISGFFDTLESLAPLLNEKGEVFLKYEIKGTAEKPKVALVHPVLKALSDVIKDATKDVASQLADKAKDVAKEKAEEKLKGKTDKATEKASQKLKKLF